MEDIITLTNCDTGKETKCIRKNIFKIKVISSSLASSPWLPTGPC